MIKNVKAVEFEVTVQEVETRFAIPTEIANAVGIRDNAKLTIRLSGSRGTWGPEAIRLKSGIELYGPPVEAVANRGEKVLVRIDAPSTEELQH